MSITLIPAYGRDYKSKRDVMKDWTDGKDFQIQDISSKWDGSYTSRRDKDKLGVVTIRYNKLRDLHIIN
jgi:hypothetical protein